MTIHKEGYPTIALSLIFIFLLIFTSSYFFGNDSFLNYFSVLFSMVFFIIILQFFRSPRRMVVENKDAVYSPADGKVVVIEEVFENEYFNDKRIQVSVFMSPLNVHVNWNPVAGLVRYVKYHPGKYLVAWHPKSSTENERTTFVIESGGNNSLATSPKTEILFRQIAGAMARRIVYYLKEGEMVGQGGEMGFIKFGSRVDIFLPVNSKINVQLNQKVKGCESIIATLT